MNNLPNDEQLQEQVITELWRCLGADFASYNLDPPPNSLPAFMQGYRAERAQQTGPTARHDRFVRKWLYLRQGALLRQRKVASDITPRVIAEIETVVCPVTLMPLTHGRRLDSDWSVDRLNNRLAYAMGNMVVMSTRANAAKASKTLAEVKALSEATQGEAGLEPREWARMAALMYGPGQIGAPASYPIRQVAPLPRWVIRESIQEWQDFFIQVAVRASAIDRRSFFASFPEVVSKPSQRLLDAICERIPQLSTPYDIWFDDEVFALLTALFMTLAKNQIDATVVIRAVYPSVSIQGRLASDLSLLSRGHLFVAPHDRKRLGKFYAARKAGPRGESDRPGVLGSHVEPEVLSNTRSLELAAPLGGGVMDGEHDSRT